jgi:signal transduction histidine kinase
VTDPPVPDRIELERLAEEQAALRRVATLVAEGAPPAEVFEALTGEIGRVMGAEAAVLLRYEPGPASVTLSSWSAGGGAVPTEPRIPPDQGAIGGMVFETRRPARVDDYEAVPHEYRARARRLGLRSVVAAPVLAQGRLWGAACVLSSRPRSFPPDTEARLTKFSELVATAIANAESREQLSRLAEEQAALRRVATLVAGGASPGEVFEAVIGEVGRLVPADSAAMSRFEGDGTLTILGAWSNTDGYLPLGQRHPLGQGTLARLVYESGRPARVVDYGVASGSSVDAVRRMGWRSGVGAPIVVEGRIWGVIGIASTTDDVLPPGTEDRLAEFTELLGSAIANTESRAELAASRARIVATADATRRRIEHDLHDGAQQQLLSVALELRATKANVPPELGELRGELSHLAASLSGVLDELREIAHGIHPAILAEGGLGPALNTLARRAPLPVTLDVHLEGRLPESVEIAAYYVVSEALTNAAKHARASAVHVAAEKRDDVLGVVVRDNGIGGADSSRGSGLLGLKDRVEAMGGTLALDSSYGSGTSLRVELPADETVSG